MKKTQEQRNRERDEKRIAQEARMKEGMSALRESLLKKANTVYLKPNREQIKLAVQKAKEVEGKPKNYIANTSTRDRQRYF